MGDSNTSGGLQRHFGLLQATALNVTMIVGAGVFATIPFMLKELPGWYALLGWVLGAALMLVDGLIWSELGATLPGSGGTYIYLLECYGGQTWGRPMAFLFIWQFLVSGPLELASGLIAISTFAPSLSPSFAAFNEKYSLGGALEFAADPQIGVSGRPAQLLAPAPGVLLIRRLCPPLAPL